MKELNITNKIIDLIDNLNIPKTESQNIDQGERLVSALAGGYLLYKSIKNLNNHPILGFQGFLASGLLLYRGATGICPIYQRMGKDTTDPQAVTIVEDITVNAPREKVYKFWRELSNLPKFMQHLKQVTEINQTDSNWEAVTPGDIVSLKWNAQITKEEENVYLGWQSIEGSMIENAGKVEFNDTLNHIGTQLHIEISYFPPAGSIGRGLASLFNGVFENMIRKDVQAFKSYVEHEDFKTYLGISTL